MPDSKWDEVERIFHAALAVEAGLRSKVVEELCAGDRALFQEVASLLAQHESDPGFLDDAPLSQSGGLGRQAPPALKKGDRLGPYEIVSGLGAGGMGEVYLAHDARLERNVAIKILADRGSVGPDHDRITREARAASALNHPGILTVYETGQHLGRGFIVTEFIDGVTLRERFRETLPLADALQLASQILSALEAAHHAGIVHRDIKPENIMIRHDGYAKLLDFGLADQGSPPILAGEAETVQPVISRGTRLLGSIPYMSPEQIRGLAPDQRSDIFAFGSVLYEMVTGRRAFDGNSNLGTLVAILYRDPPPVRQWNKRVPAPLARIISKCLAKDAVDRYFDIAELRRALLELSPSTRSNRWRRARFFSAIALAGVTGVVAAYGGLLWALGRNFPFGEVRVREGPRITGLQQITSDASVNASPALSEDGRWVAYASNREGSGNFRLWLLDRQTKRSQLIAGGAKDTTEPTLSSNGAMAAYTRFEESGPAIYVFDVKAGTSTRIAAHGRNPAISPDGTKVAYWNESEKFGAGSVYAYSIATATTVQLPCPRQLCSYPIWAPDSRRILFLAEDPANRGWYIADSTAPTGIESVADYEAVISKIAQRSPLRSSFQPYPAHAVAWRGPYIFFAATLGGFFDASRSDRRAVFRARIEHGSWKLFDVVPVRETDTVGADFAITSSAFVFGVSSATPDVWRVPASSGDAPSSVVAERVDTGHLGAVMSSVTSNETAIGVFRENGIFSGADYPRLSLGMRVVISDDRSARMLPDGTGFYGLELERVVIKRANQGPDQWENLCVRCGWPSQVMSNGLLLLRSSETEWDTIDPSTKKRARAFTISNRADRQIDGVHVSPDLGWVAFHSCRSTRNCQVSVCKLPCSGDERHWIAVTDETTWNAFPAWSPDGQSLYFLSDRDGFRCVWRTAAPTTRKSAEPKGFFHLHNAARSLRTFREPSLIGLEAAGKHVYLSVAESKGNLWSGKLVEP